MRDLTRLLTYLKPHWGKFTLATVAMVVGAVLQKRVGGLIVPIFDQASQRQTPGPQPDDFESANASFPDSGFDAGVPSRFD